MKYLLDTNVFIAAKNTYYAFDICPGFWKWIESCPALCSVEKVLEELKDGNDELCEWIKDLSRQAPSFFIQATEDIQNMYGGILSYIHTLKKYNDSALSEYASVADSWIVAAAKVLGYGIITNEKKDPNCKKRIKIPDVADMYKIPCYSLFHVMRQYNVILDIQ